MNRGEIWTVAGGIYASKPRPAVIIQDDRFSATSSVTLCPLTTTTSDAPLLRIALGATALSGLSSDSFVMIDKLTTVRRNQVQVQVGRVTASQMVDIERSLFVFLGLAG